MGRSFEKTGDGNGIEFPSKKRIEKEHGERKERKENFLESLKN